MEARPAKRARVASERRMTRESFVKAMVLSVADTLASDSEYGHNSSNRIRMNLEDIADDIDDRDPVRSSARAVLEARFALGHDDSQYMAQAVSLLWAGDGGERLRLVPSSVMSSIMRVASAKGMIRGMARVVQSRRVGAMHSVQRAAHLAAWLLQEPVLRDACVHALSKSAEEEVRDKATQLDKAYKEGDAKGVAYATELFKNDTNAAFHLTKALCMLCDRQSPPHQVLGLLKQAAEKVVRRAEVDLLQLYTAVRSMGGARAYRTKVALAPAADEGAGAIPRASLVDTTRLCNDMRGGKRGMSNANPSFEDFATALHEAVGRIGNRSTSSPVQGSNVATNKEHDTETKAQIDYSKPWTLQGVLSPMWRENSLMWAEASSELPETANASEASAKTAIAISTCNARGGCDRPEKIELHATAMLDGSVPRDECLVQFCVMRGVCGFRGPHQNTNKGNPLEYTYAADCAVQHPQGYSAADYSSVKTTRLPDHIRVELEADGARLYSTANLKLDTDFVGNVTRLTTALEVGASRPEVESSKVVQWLPVLKEKPIDQEDHRFAVDEHSQAMCNAAMLELMAFSLQNPAIEYQHEIHMATVFAAAAAAKLEQVHAMATMRSTQAANGTMLDSSSWNGGYAFATRPCANCSTDGAPLDADNLMLPVDAGVAEFRRLDNGQDPLNIPRAAGEASASMATTTDGLDANFANEVSSANAYLSKNLQAGMESGWVGKDVFEKHRPFSLFMGPAADAQPVTEQPEEYLKRLNKRDRVLPEDVNLRAMHNVFADALSAFDAIAQLECEEEYVQRFVDGDDELLHNVFQTYRNVEDATRDRRGDVWSDAMREVSISGDRLYRFVTTLTGSIGEAADSAISWEDDDLKALSKEATQRQKAMADRVSQFQTKLVESVVSSTLRASKLQLDVRERQNAGNELVVINSEVKDNIRQITSGEAGHGFFEASVELNNVLGATAKPITVKDLVRRLQSVSEEFQESVSHSLSAATPASYARVSEPRNSYMLHLKLDTSAAIQKAFDLISSELARCPGYHRHVHLWEFVEGKDWVMTTRFAELVGLMLQNTRMRSGSFAAYVGTAQIVTNTQNIRTQIQRLLSRVCEYINHSHSVPDFLSKSGRVYYFGGSTRARGSRELDKQANRASRRGVPDAGGGDDDDDSWFWNEFRNTTPFEYSGALFRRLRASARRKDKRNIPYFKVLELNAHPDTRLPSGDKYGDVVQTLFTELADDLRRMDATIDDVLETLLRNTERYVNTGATGHDASKFCSQLASAVSGDADQSFTLALCKQLEEMKVGLSPNKSVFVLPKAVALDGAMPGRLYYDVKFDVHDIGPARQLPWGSDTYTRGNAASDVVHLANIALNCCFGTSPKDGDWKPHPKWTVWREDTEFRAHWVRMEHNKDPVRTQLHERVANQLNATESTFGSGWGKVMTFALTAMTLSGNAYLSNHTDFMKKVSQGSEFSYVNETGFLLPNVFNLTSDDTLRQIAKETKNAVAVEMKMLESNATAMNQAAQNLEKSGNSDAMRRALKEAENFMRMIRESRQVIEDYYRNFNGNSALNRDSVANSLLGQQIARRIADLPIATPDSVARQAVQRWLDANCASRELAACQTYLNQMYDERPESLVAMKTDAFVDQLNNNDPEDDLAANTGLFNFGTDVAAKTVEELVSELERQVVKDAVELDEDRRVFAAKALGSAAFSAFTLDFDGAGDSLRSLGSLPVNQIVTTRLSVNRKLLKILKGTESSVSETGRMKRAFMGILALENQSKNSFRKALDREYREVLKAVQSASDNTVDYLKSQKFRIAAEDQIQRSEMLGQSPERKQRALELLAKATTGDQFAATELQMYMFESVASEYKERIEAAIREAEKQAQALKQNQVTVEVTLAESLNVWWENAMSWEERPWWEIIMKKRKEREANPPSSPPPPLNPAPEPNKDPVVAHYFGIFTHGQTLGSTMKSYTV